uniref:Glycosyltransferase n=1 Tax=Linum usitatissimum TaxID=4006 RepID=I2BH19_LINUS|nr:UDP-glycosyltransferase 1 [Linum usitatissimum]
MVPIPAIGHLPPVVEFSKRITARNSQLSVTIVLIRTPFSPEVDSFSDRLAESCKDCKAINFIRISEPKFPPIDSYSSVHSFFPKFLDSQTDAVKQALAARFSGDSSVSLAGIVVDILTTAMVDLGKELGVPSYLFFPSCAAILGHLVHLPAMGYSPEVAVGDPDGEVVYPSFEHPMPNRILPAIVLDGQGYQELMGHTRKYNEVDGIVVNSYVGLESRAINILNGKVDGVFRIGGKSFPPVFPVGPVLNLKGHATLGNTKSLSEKAMTWLDDQPPQSVVFMCFGSLGSFTDAQLGEVAAGLERARHVRFLWVMRKISSGDSKWTPNDCEDYSPSSPALNALGEGFLERTRGRVMVCGWLPQAAILAHKAIGGFMSHCGWNSILESLWHGVPMLAWPMYAEQQMNAFYMTTELGLAVELRADYRIWKSDEDGEMVVKGDEIARKIEMVMDKHSEVRKKVKEMSELGRRALNEGGSSFDGIDGFMDLVLKNKPMV